jgi:hypothetical protein
MAAVLLAASFGLRVSGFDEEPRQGNPDQHGNKEE